MSMNVITKIVNRYFLFLYCRSMQRNRAQQDDWAFKYQIGRHITLMSHLSRQRKTPTTISAVCWEDRVAM